MPISILNFLSVNFSDACLTGYNVTLVVAVNKTFGHESRDTNLQPNHLPQAIVIQRDDFFNCNCGVPLDKIVQVN